MYAKILYKITTFRQLLFYIDFIDKMRYYICMRYLSDISNDRNFKKDIISAL